MRSRSEEMRSRWLRKVRSAKRRKNKSVNSIHPQLILSLSSSGAMQHISPSRTATKPHREKDAAPITTDIHEKMIAFKRKQAKYVESTSVPSSLFVFPSHILVRFSSHVRVKDRTERPVVPPQGPPSPPRRQQPSGQSPPAVHISGPEPDPNEFSRVLTLSPTQKPPPHPPMHRQQGKLFNPDTDPIPMRRTAEPEASSESAGSSYAPRKPSDASGHNRDAPQPRQLFDHTKDDPLAFSSARARTPAPTSSGDY